MSGYKHATVTISQEEYRRLQDADIKKRLKEYSRTKTQDSGQNEVVLNLLHQLEERERQLQSTLGSIGHDTSGMDNRLLQDLLNQNSVYYENLITSLNSANLDIQDSLTSITADFYQAIQLERDTFNQNLQSLIVEQNYYQNNEYLKAEAAQQWFRGCLTMVDFIEVQFDHERFAPGRLNRVLRTLNLVENNLSNGFYESALQASQQMYLELSDLNFELENLVLQWQTLFESTYSAIKEIIFQMVSNGKVNAVGLKGEMLPNFVDLNYWTNGRFHQLLEHTRQLSTNLIQDQNIISSEDLDRIYNQILPVIRESFESLVFEARVSALNSQLRMNIAEKALLALENHGFCLDRSGYENDDMRTQFNAHLACPDGSEVTINVLPNEITSEQLANDLVVITTHPYLKTEHEDRMQWEELSNVLRHYNLKVSQPEIIDVPNLTDTDVSSQSFQAEHHYTQIER